jgi:hypothetical protein
MLFAPPALAAIYVVAVLFQADWLNQSLAIASAICVSLLGAVAVVLRRRPRLPSVGRAARLVDQRSGAKDHFLTLATIDPADQPATFLTRLRAQAEGFRSRVKIPRDFPYRFQRSAYWSLGVSLIAAALIHLLLPFAQSPARYSAAVPEHLRELAQRMEIRPELRQLAKELRDLAAKLDDPKTPDAEKQALRERMEQKLEEQKKKEEEKNNQDLLAQASSALNGTEKQQQAASGQQQEKQQKGAGGIQTNAPQDGQGENKQSQSGSGDGKGDSVAQLSQDKLDQGKSAQPKEPGKEKSQSGEARNDQNQPDPSQPGKEPNKENAAKTQGGSREGAGKQQASADPPPQGGPQADRFYKPGEGREGLGTKGYVSVQLPEEVVADAKGESRITKESKNNRTRSQIPVSNVPLPAHIPNAAAEKQQLPIEYRGVIR